MNSCDACGPDVAIVSCEGMDSPLIECGTWSDHEARAWTGYVVQEIEGDEPSVLIFCPECAAEEFDHRSRPADDALGGERMLGLRGAENGTVLARRRPSATHSG